MSSMLIKNPATSSDRFISRRKKKKKNLILKDQNHNSNDNCKWKSQAQQQVYSSKLLKALRGIQISSGEPSPATASQTVREVADRVLANTAKGRSRWSRAILTNRLKLKFMKRHSKKQRAVASATSRLAKKPKLGVLKLRRKNFPAFQKKARVLGRIVPGCRKQPVPVILEEATDYIAALQMQIRAMSALADLLSSTSSTSSTVFVDQLGSSQPPHI